MPGLYDDVDVNLESEEIESLRKDILSLQSALLGVKKENQELRTTATASEATIAILERNMSTLFSTAKLEMRRKDNEIAKLRKLLERERKAAGVNLDSIRTYCLRVQVEYDSFKKSIAKAVPEMPSTLQDTIKTFEDVILAPFTHNKGRSTQTSDAEHTKALSRADSRDKFDSSLSNVPTTGGVENSSSQQYQSKQNTKQSTQSTETRRKRNWNDNANNAQNQTRYSYPAPPIAPITTPSAYSNVQNRMHYPAPPTRGQYPFPLPPMTSPPPSGQQHPAGMAFPLPYHQPQSPTIDSQHIYYPSIRHDQSHTPSHSDSTLTWNTQQPNQTIHPYPPHNPHVAPHSGMQNR